MKPLFEVIDMDVFQVLTLCSLLAVMFVGVLGYGMFRNWQRGQLELVRTPSVGTEFSIGRDSPQRIYPNVDLTRNSKSKKEGPNLRPSTVKGPEVHVEPKTSADPKRILDDNNSADARAKGPRNTSKGKVDSTAVTNRPAPRKALIQSDSTRVKPEESQKAKTSSETTQTEDDGLEAFRRSSTHSQEAEGEKRPKAKFLRAKKSSQLEQKPPQSLKRRKPKSESRSGVATRKTTRNPKSQGTQSGDDFVMFSVLGEHDGSFRMKEVGVFLQSRGLVLDDLGLFCCNDRESGEVLFKVSDVFFPGSFDVKNLDHYRTRGISLAMKLDSESNAQVVFEQMLTLAKDCAEQFLGTVKDENYNNMSNQTLAHYRHRVSDYRRKQLTAYG